MYTFPVPLRRGLGIWLGVLAVTMAHDRKSAAAEPPPGSVHRMVIQDGPNRSVHYVASGNLSTSDRLAALNLERAENELTYVKDLQQLKHQYVRDERSLQPWRRYVQGYLYGARTSSGSFNSGSISYLPNGIYGTPAGPYGYNSSYFPYSNGYGYGGYRRRGYASQGGSWSSETHSLQYGMGDEGRVKNAVVSVITKQASPEYAAAVARDYETAVSHAAASPILSRDLGLSKSSAPAPAAELTFAKGGKVTIWVGNEKYVGTVKDDLPGWIVLQTDKAEVTVRKSEITRAEVPPKP
jgi:hypothetical protein